MKAGLYPSHHPEKSVLIDLENPPVSAFQIVSIRLVNKQ